MQNCIQNKIIAIELRNGKKFSFNIKLLVFQKVVKLFSELFFFSFQRYLMGVIDNLKKKKSNEAPHGCCW